MRPEEYDTTKLVGLLEKEGMMTLDRIAEALGRPSRATIFRKLARLGGRASYSHCGRYQTLDRIADYDQNGLWSLRGVGFSKQGTLLETIVHLVEHSKEGYYASDLETLLQVRVHNALAHLYEAKRLGREQHGNQHLYVSATADSGQLKERYQAIERAQDEREAAGVQTPDENCENMLLLLKVLNEKQRRLYLGLESIRVGHGGDAKISRMTGVNVKTVALGRRQLQAGNIDIDRVREVGGGRRSVKKKRKC